MNSPAYDTVSEETRAASAKFAQVARDYRARKIGDKAFLEAHAEHQEAMARFDAAFAQDQLLVAP